MQQLFFACAGFAGSLVVPVILSLYIGRQYFPGRPTAQNLVHLAFIGLSVFLFVEIGLFASEKPRTVDGWTWTGMALIVAVVAVVIVGINFYIIGPFIRRK